MEQLNEKELCLLLVKESNYDVAKTEKLYNFIIGEQQKEPVVREAKPVMEKKKYKLTEETIYLGKTKLYRIEALKDFYDVKKGDKGGWVEHEGNLSQLGYCWVYDNAIVKDNAVVKGDAQVMDHAKILDYAIVDDNAMVYDRVKVYGSAIVNGNARICNYALICDSAQVCGDVQVLNDTIIRGDAIVEYVSDYIVFKNWWSSGRYFTWTRSNNMYSVGCFYGTGEELIAKAYKDSELSGREYERVVNYVKSILEDNKT